MYVSTFSTYLCRSTGCFLQLCLIHMVQPSLVCPLYVWIINLSINWTGKILCSSKPRFYFPPCCLSLLANHEIVIYLHIYMDINCPFVSLKLEWLLLSLSLKNRHDFSYITSYDLSIALASYRVRLFLHKPTQTLAKKISIKVV